MDSDSGLGQQRFRVLASCAPTPYLGRNTPKREVIRDQPRRAVKARGRSLDKVGTRESFVDSEFFVHLLVMCVAVGRRR